MQKKRFKLRNTAIIFLGMAALLAGCSDSATPNSENSTEVAEEKITANNELPLSEALPKYKIWYTFFRTNNNPVTKDDSPDVIYYFDGENTECYSLFYSDEPVLTISELLDMSEEEQLEYIRGVDASLPLIDSRKNVTVPYHLNIVTDGSGNYTDYEEFTV